MTYQNYLPLSGITWFAATEAVVALNSSFTFSLVGGSYWQFAPGYMLFSWFLKTGYGLCKSDRFRVILAPCSYMYDVVFRTSKVTDQWNIGLSQTLKNLHAQAENRNGDPSIWSRALYHIAIKASKAVQVYDIPNQYPVTFSHSILNWSSNS